MFTELTTTLNNRRINIDNTDIIQFYEGDVPSTFKVDGEGNRRIITLGDGSKLRFAPIKYKLHLVENLSDSKVIPNNKKHQGEFFLENYALDNPEDGFFSEGHWLPVAILDPTRVMYAGKYEAGVKSEVVCKSNDGKTPSKTILVPQSPTCTDCEQSKWYKGDDGGSKPPRCTETIHVVFFDIDKKIFFTYGFTSTRISPWNKLVKKINTILDTAFIRGIDLTTYVIIAKTEDKKSYYNFNFDFVAMPSINTEIFKPLISWYQQNILPELIKERQAFEDNAAMNVPSDMIDAQVADGFAKVGLGDSEESDSDSEFKDIKL